MSKIFPTVIEKINEYDLKDLYYSLELPLVDVLTTMEDNGVMISREKLEEFKNIVFKEVQEYPIHWFTNKKINEKGQTVLTVPSLDLKNIDENQDVLELHIHKKMYEYEDISGNMHLVFALNYIIENFNAEG